MKSNIIEGEFNIIPVYLISFWPICAYLCLFVLIWGAYLCLFVLITVYLILYKPIAMFIAFDRP